MMYWMMYERGPSPPIVDRGNCLLRDDDRHGKITSNGTYDRSTPNVYTSTGAAYIVLNPEYAKPTHRGARTGVFIGLGLCSVLPVSHALLSHGVVTLCGEMGFAWLLTSGALYIGGALL